MTLNDELSNSEHANALKRHPLLKIMWTTPLKRDQVVTVLSQWYHPLHYFPVFLSRHIAVTPTIAAKTFISKIIWQELGEGVPERAHETIYIDTMNAVGFDNGEFVEREQLPATAALLKGYAEAARTGYLKSLGYLFATECADLAMVGSIGVAVRKLTGAARLPWVDIHVQQEPDHTESVGDVLESDLSPEDRETVRQAAEEMFTLWCNFFSAIAKAIDQPLGVQIAA